MSSAIRDNPAIHFSVHGQGSAIVLGHSFLCSGAMWAEQVKPLAEQYRVVNIDFRGHGASGRVRGGFSIYDMVDDVLSVLDQLAIESAVWAGLSIGGMVALRAALTVPQRVDGLILLDTDAGAENWRKRTRLELLAAIARLAGIRPLLPQIVKQMFGATTIRTQPDLIAEWKQHFSELDLQSALKMLKALQTRDDVSPRLPEIAVPALVLCGAEDRALPPNRSRRIAEGLPSAKYVEIVDAGHLSTLEQPEKVTALMLEFLKAFPVQASSEERS